MQKTYNPLDVEDKWYAHWLKQDFFSAKVNPEKEAYTIVIPPPNVTGVLHMGHMLNNTIQDVLIRKARMEGKEACWVPGTDHASIATEAKVVKMLREQGIKKSDLSREEFLKHAHEWKDKYGGIILEQLKKLGASCDWERTAFTMDEGYYKSVIRVFIDMYNKGYIYRGLRMINWDPEAKTALSNEEVIYNDEGEPSKLFSVRYKIADTDDEWITIATTRPETILADTGIAINPDDERYQHLKGKKAIVPFTGREVPIIFDDYVEKDFGTGCLKVTPAHDQNDYDIGERHNLEVIDCLNEDGTLNAHGGKYEGQDRFVARKNIVKDLDEAGQLVKTEEIVNKVGRSERTNAVVEPRLSLQWFLDMKKVSGPALDNVMNGNIKFHPDKFIGTYRHWMENVRDWCLSRQLWWGHRIPAYYFGKGENDFVVAETMEEALKLAQEKSGNASLTANDLKQDEDVLDTWASSWLWPLATFSEYENGTFTSEELDYFYPTNVLVTAPEILFFWVARMIIAGYEYKDEKPFHDVYLTGIVRDKLGRKMSKSLGNSPDPIELMKEYGADGVRTGMLFSSPAGNDLPFDVKLCEQGRNFSNKIWNALRLIKGFEVVEGENKDNDIAIAWFRSRLAQAIDRLEMQYSQYRISDALMTLYKLIWDDFCSWYLEMIKPEYQKPIDSATLNTTIAFFEDLMKLLHPFMPFLTEELWHYTGERDEKECIIVAEYPQKTDEVDETLLKEAEFMFEVVSQARAVRTSKNIPKKDAVSLHIKTTQPELYQKFGTVIQKLAGVSEMQFSEEKPAQAVSFIVKSDECSIPMEGLIDMEAEREALQKDLDYTLGFLKSVEKKLSNERFVNNAPEQVVAAEQKKKADAEAKIKALEESLAGLG
ncbi:MAG: valine--tRNA ligase [Bacteroidota bacterium]